MSERESLKDMVSSANERRKAAAASGARTDFISAAMNAANAAAEKAGSDRGGNIPSESSNMAKLVIVLVAAFAALAVFALGYWRS